MPAHPRSRGENTASFFGSADTLGSSPLTRGKQPMVIPSVLWRGLIPAHAGKTTFRCDSTGIAWAHPRSRGENAASTAARKVSLGSSPLTRGKRRTPPARARARRAHPRSRGENSAAFGWINGSLGSSPLTRGKPGKHLNIPMYEGLIPAHAGKTARTKDTKPKCRAHPRSRGENGTPASARRSRSGSSPLTRGKLHRSARRQDQRRLIPAHAGKTWNHSTTTLTAAAHPRSRGENDAAEHELRAAQGSSPLTRGKRDAFAPGVGDPGLIPAHAGKTTAGQCRRGRQRAHPRSRGENVLTRARPGGHHGSSPLTRGKPSGGR